MRVNSSVKSGVIQKETIGNKSARGAILEGCDVNIIKQVKRLITKMK